MIDASGPGVQPDVPDVAAPDGGLMDDVGGLLPDVLPPAVAVMTAWLGTRDDPEPFWSEVEQALVDSPAPGGDAEPLRAYAYLVCGLCALCEIALTDLASVVGKRREEVLQTIRRAHANNG